MTLRPPPKATLGVDEAEAVDWPAAIAVFEGLSRPGRLAVFRCVVRAGQAGTGAAELIRELRTTGSALTFHLRALADIGLIRPQDGFRRARGGGVQFVADLGRLAASVRLVESEAPRQGEE